MGKTIDKLISSELSDWKSRAEFRRKNKYILGKCAKIVLEMIDNAKKSK